MGIWYRTGTVAVTNGSPNIVGVGTLWLTQASVGDIFLGPDLVEYEITSITDDTHLAVKQVNNTAAYAGTTNSAQIYAIIRNFTSTIPAALASQLAALMTTYHVTLDELTAWLSGTGTVTVHDAVGNAYSVQTPAALEAALTGRLVKSVAGGASVTLTSAEASNLFIELTGALTANINLILPAGVRHNFVLNSTTGAYTVTVKTAAGTGIAVAQGARALLECDGTNVVNAQSQLDNATLTGTTQVEDLSASGTISAAGAVSGQNFSGTASGFSIGLVSDAYSTAYQVFGSGGGGAAHTLLGVISGALRTKTSAAGFDVIGDLVASEDVRGSSIISYTVNKTVASGATVDLISIGSYSAELSGVIHIRATPPASGRLTSRRYSIDMMGAGSNSIDVLSTSIYSTGSAFTLAGVANSPSAGYNKLTLTNNDSVSVDYSITYQWNYNGGVTYY